MCVYIGIHESPKLRGRLYIITYIITINSFHTLNHFLNHLSPISYIDFLRTCFFFIKSIRSCFSSKCVCELCNNEQKNEHANSLR